MVLKIDANYFYRLFFQKKIIEKEVFYILME